MYLQSQKEQSVITKRGQMNLSYNGEVTLHLWNSGISKGKYKIHKKRIYRTFRVIYYNIKNESY